MAHPTFQVLVDYLDFQLAENRRASVERHLATCAECQQALTLAQDFLAGARQPAPVPPPSLVRLALSAVKRQLNRVQQRSIESAIFSFDSWALAATSGARGATAERQLLYTLDPYDLDLQIGPDPQGQTLLLRGQLLASEPQPAGLEGITIRLLREDEEQALRLTDELGRFSISNLSPGSYTLQVVLEQRDILIENVSLTV
jgi:hypothetical protein